MVDREMLSAISELLDEKLEEKLDQKLDQKLRPIYDRLDSLDARVGRLENDMHYVKVVQLENNVIPRLNTIESCYLDTSERYLERTEQMDDMAADIVVLKNVVSEHSEILQRMQG